MIKHKVWPQDGQSSLETQLATNPVELATHPKKHKQQQSLSTEVGGASPTESNLSESNLREANLSAKDLNATNSGFASVHASE